MTKGDFRTRVLALALLPAATMTALLVVFFTGARLGEVDAELSARGQAIARQLAPACEYGVFSNNKAVLSRLARAALNEADVLAVTIRDQTGEVLVDARASALYNAGAPASKTARIFRAPIMPSEVPIEDFSVAGPSIPSHETQRPPLGSVEVELSESALVTRERTIIGQSLGLAILALAVILWLALRAAKSVSVPVLALAGTMQKLKQGQLDVQVNVNAPGELGVLQRGVNDMIAALRQAREVEAQRAEDKLYLEKVRAQVTLQSLGEGIISTDAAGHVTFVNTAAEHLLGVSAVDAQGLPLAEVVPSAEGGSALRCLELGSVVRSEGYRRLVRRDGKEFSVRESAAPVRDRTGHIIGMVLVLHDVTQMHQMAQQLAFQASHDPLTGLLNRHAFELRLQQMIENGRIEARQHVLCYLDLDQFKMVNDTCGHAAGDELLKQLTFILRACLRRGDTIARLGGDEFGIVFEDCTVSEALPLAESLRATIAAFRFGWGDHAFDVGASLGMVPINEDSGTLQDILRAADSACYVAKDLGRDRIHVYEPHDQALAKHRGEMQWARRLKRGFEEDQLVLFAQQILPLADCPIGAAPNYEITVMMRSDDGQTLIPPMAFIPAAERFRLMPALDRWVIRAAFRNLRDLMQAEPGMAPRPLRYAINVSGQSLCDGQLLPFVMNEFEATGISPEQICFEITETAAIANLGNAVDVLGSLRELRCTVALDDFGSGLSSFGYLKHLPVDLIKIDGAFVKDIVRDKVSLSMVEAINHIGHEMGLATIAESVESESILSKLKEIGVDYAQGFFLGKPLPLDSRVQGNRGGLTGSGTSYSL